MLYLLLGVLLGVLIYHKLVRPLKYWEENGVISEPAWPIVGNMVGTVLKKVHLADFVTFLYNKYPEHRYVGYLQFTLPVLLIRDLDLIKQITVKDFDHFHDHLFSTVQNDNDPLMSKSLINLTGDKWTQMRATLSPAFTGSKMRHIYSLTRDCAKIFVTQFKGKERVAVEMKDLCSRFTTDVIASTAFGINVNSIREPNNRFLVMARRLTRFTSWTFAKMALLTAMPSLAHKLDIRLFPRNITDFFRSIVKDTIARRETGEMVRRDMLQLLIEARSGVLGHDSGEDQAEEFATVAESHIGRMELSEDHIVSQAMLFFFAGFETVSTASAFVAHELAVHWDVQRKLQEEIDAVNGQYQGGDVPYETLLGMKYLDQVVCETLRLWPPSFQLDRLCTQDLTIPPQRPTEKEFVLRRGTAVVIPAIAIHRDPRYYTEPDRFDPDRFSDENRAKILPGTYLPFGAGPRNCIGSRFALLEVKTLFFHLLSKFDIVPTDDTEIPLKISPKKMTLAPRNGFRLALKPRRVSSY